VNRGAAHEVWSAGSVSRNHLRFALATSIVVMSALLKWSADLRTQWTDLAVYLGGGHSLLAGTPLYAIEPGHLPFTYSPFAALIFVPLFLLSLAWAKVLVSVGSVACFGVIIFVTTHELDLSWPKTALLAVGGLSLEPVVMTLLQGQINLFLMMLVLVDCLILGDRSRGLLVGLAAGIKIVPGAFVLYFLLKRDWSAVVRALIAWAFSVAVGFVVAPADSMSYWGGGFLNLGKFGLEALSRGDNQSLRGVVLRSFGWLDYGSPAVLLVSGLVMVLGLEAARRQLRAGDDLAALSCIGLAALLASPVSWTHHWVWIVIPIAVLISRAQWVRVWLVGTIFLVGPMWLVPMGNLQERHHTFPQSVSAAAYVLVGLLLLVDLMFNTSPTSGSVPDRRRPMARSSLGENRGTAEQP
jgi:alpha-1,2-mannosyltransferase